MATTQFMFENKPATIEAINVRKQGPKDGRIVALDLKITAEDLPMRCLAALLCAQPAEVEAAFWRLEDFATLREGQKLDRRFIGLQSFACPAVYAKRHELRIANLAPIRVDKLHKFEATPVAGQLCVVTFVAVISDPPDGWGAELMHLLRETCMVGVEQDAELDLGDSASTTERARRGDKAARGGKGSKDDPITVGPGAELLPGPGRKALPAPSGRRLQLGGPTKPPK